MPLDYAPVEEIRPKERERRIANFASRVTLLLLVLTGVAWVILLLLTR